MKYEDYFKRVCWYDKFIENFEEKIKDYPAIVKIIEESEDIVEVGKKLFEQRYDIITTLPPFMNEKPIARTQFFAIAIFHTNDWDFIPYVIETMAKDNGCEILETDSDVGSTKIGNDDFSVQINNCMGDGITKNIIDTNNTFDCKSFFDYFTVINGKFNIYDYDCGESVAKTLNGEYFVYSGFGYVLFSKED